jgi:hypothetical protein
MNPSHLFRPCTIEHFKMLSRDFEHCVEDGKTPEQCSEETFERARCIQWTGLDTKMDFLDFIGRPRDEPENITFSGYNAVYR